MSSFQLRLFVSFLLGSMAHIRNSTLFPCNVVNMLADVHTNGASGIAVRRQASV